MKKITTGDIPTNEPMKNTQYSDSTPCSIVIRAYNEEKHIGRLLTGIQQQTIQNIEIILVDSGSTDRTTQIAADYGVRIINIRPDDFTFGRSLNRGIEQARGEFIVIASAHVYPTYPDWIESLLKPFSDPLIALTYGKQRGNQNTQFSEHQIFAKWFPEESNAKQCHPFCNNANAAIRRSLWEKFPYDETLPGLEDLAWAKKILEQSYYLAYVPEAEIIHIHQESWKSIFNRYRREAMAFKHIFPNERFNLSDFFRLLAINISSDLKTASKKKVLIKSLINIFRFRIMQFWGTYKGYQQSGPLTWQLRQTFYYPHNTEVLSQTPQRKTRPIQYIEPTKEKK